MHQCWQRLLYYLESALSRAFEKSLLSSPLYGKGECNTIFCEKVVRVSNLPLAQYISDGQWAVSTVQELKFSQVCPTSERGTETTIRPVGVLRLPMSCQAVHGQKPYPHIFAEKRLSNSPQTTLIL